MSLFGMALTGIAGDQPRPDVCARERLFTVGFALLGVHAFLAGPLAAARTYRLVDDGLSVLSTFGFVLGAMVAILACVLAGVLLARRNTLAGGVVALAVWFLMGYALGAAVPPGLPFAAAAVGDLAAAVIVTALWCNVNIWVAAVCAAGLTVWLAPAYVATFGFRMLPATPVRLILMAGIAVANRQVIALLRMGRHSLRSAVLLTLGVQAVVATGLADAAIATIIRRRAP
jgi:hypothetical protein